MARTPTLAVSAILASGVCLLCAAAPGARAISASDAVARSCAVAADGERARGVVARRWTAPAEGQLSARLTGGAASDWDLAIFRRGAERASAASTSFTSDELATAWASSGETLIVQACRLEGRDASAALELDFVAGERPAPPAEPTSLASVAISGAADLARLEGLGIDVTHDVTPDSATVVLHSDAQRALLASSGFASRTLVADLGAENAADRRAERRLARRAGRSALPSGRNNYRVYTNYTTELKGLADDNPDLVRSIELGESVDGRPIEGVEIANRVNRSDGRPVFVNVGIHHAREWPSGEFPIEFAIDLVDSFNGGDPRVTSLLRRVRVVIVPVVNPDGFIVSRDTAAGEFRRKNCRPTLGDAAIPCEARSTFSGVDLNRNYGAYWGGAGSSS